MDAVVTGPGPEIRPRGCTALESFYRERRFATSSSILPTLASNRELANQIPRIPIDGGRRLGIIERLVREALELTAEQLPRRDDEWL